MDIEIALKHMDSYMAYLFRGLNLSDVSDEEFNTKIAVNN